MSNPLVSIIIPVYKVEKYLKECVDSVIVQTYKNMEIILVDDGSPDKSGEICDAYSEKDSRIKVIHKENGGLSSARNTGIRAANGEYIQFLDSDDFLCDNTCIEKLVKIMEDDYDFVLFNTVEGYIDENRYVNSQGLYDLNVFLCGDKARIFKYMVKTHKPLGVAYNKIIQRRTIQENNVYFKEGIIAEDIDWIIRLFRASRKITAVNETYYVYRKGVSTSITSNVTDKTIWNLYNTIREQSDLEKGKTDSFSEAVLSFMAFIYATLLYNIGRHGDIAKFAEVKEYAWLFKYSIDIRTRVMCLLYTMFGFQKSIKIIGRLHDVGRRILEK